MTELFQSLGAGIAIGLLLGKVVAAIIMNR